MYNNGSKDPNKATYKDSLTARAYCVAMFNKEVEFQLWEDDAAGKGHNPEVNKNNKLPQKFTARVNAKGIAEIKISLLSNEKILRSIANKYLSAGDKTEGANHEYYVTASYGGKIQGASKVNVNVATSGAQPKRDSAIFSGTSNQPPKSDKESKITHAYFVDSKGNPTQKIKVGDSVRIRIKTQNMIHENIQYVVWEKDGLKDDEIFRSPSLKIIDNAIDTSAITITPQKFDDGIDYKSPKIKDEDKKQQQYYIEIVPLESQAKSVSFGIDDEDKRTKVDNVKTAAVVKEEKVEQKDNKGNCIPCQIGLSVQDLDKFMKATPHGSILNVAPYNTRIPLYISYLNQYMTLFEINKNCYRRANFLGQVAKETKFWSYKEDFVYKSSILKSKFSNFKTDQGIKYADLWGYKDDKTEVTKEREIKIANWAYSRGSKATDLGNKICPENDVANAEHDGYKYRGRGLIQLTGRNNYTSFQSWFNDNRAKLKLPIVDFISNPDLVFEPQYIVLSAVYYWIKNGLNNIADEGVSKETIQKISNKINSGEEQAKKDMRYDYVKSAHSMLSEKSKDCPFKTNYEAQTGSWHDPVDNPQLCLYSQGGNSKKPWHGSFGPTIRDGVNKHTGMDLFAIPDTKVYACVKGVVVRSETNSSMFGEMIVIKVTDEKTIKARRKNPFTLKYAHKSEIESQNFDHNGTFYLVYAHLKERKVAIDDIVEAGKEIGRSGTSGNNGVPFSTKNPHVHFEIMNVEKQGGLEKKCNPGVYLTYKDEDSLTVADIAAQEEARTTPKFWKQ